VSVCLYDVCLSVRLDGVCTTCGVWHVGCERDVCVWYVCVNCVCNKPRATCSIRYVLPSLNAPLHSLYVSHLLPVRPILLLAAV